MQIKLSELPKRSTSAAAQAGQNIYLDKDTQLTHHGAYIGSLETIGAGMRCDCPHGEKHSDGKGQDYAVTTQLSGGEVGIHCSGSECDGLRYLPTTELTKEQKIEWAKSQESFDPIEDEHAAPKEAPSFDDFLKEMSDPSLLAVPKELVPIEDTYERFFWGGMHLIHGISKVGKTYFALDTLNKAKDARVIWLDGDQNDSKMVERFKNMTHLAPLSPDKYLDRWLKSGVSFDGVVFVIDSLKDFRNGNEMDSNTGMDSIIKRLKHFTKLGATVVVIHHSTPLWDGGKIKGVKLKGNAEAVYGNTDITYLLERDFDKKESKLTCERSRVDEMPTGKVQKINAFSITSINSDPLGGNK